MRRTPRGAWSRAALTFSNFARSKCWRLTSWLWRNKSAQLTAAAGVPFIINDHPWLVPRTGADGAHIGQDDGPITAAREKAGPGKMIGRSTHSFDQALAARDEGADYLGFGPLFATPTKPDYNPSVSKRSRAFHAEITDRPIFCIGGIKLENLAEVIDAGARGW